MPKSALYGVAIAGLLVALEVLFAITKGKKASIFFNKFKKIPQILKNIEVKDKEIINKPEIKKSIKAAEKLMKRNVRVRAYDNDAIRNYIRVSVGTLDEMQATVNVLKDLLKT